MNMYEPATSLTPERAQTQDPANRLGLQCALNGHDALTRPPRCTLLPVEPAFPRWPALVEGAPPGWPLPDGPWQRTKGGEGQPHACQLQLDARRIVNGHLLALDLSRSSLLWLDADQPDAGLTELPFSAFRCLRLLTLLPVAPRDATDAGPLPPAVPFRIEFADGGVWRGQTCRLTERVSGFFAYQPVDEIGNLRLAFVPRSAWRSLHIGAAPVPGVTSTVATTEGGDSSPRVTTPRATSPSLGQVLIGLGLINQAQLDDALAEQRQHRGLQLGQLLIRRGALTPEGLAHALAVRSDPRTESGHCSFPPIA